MASSVVVDSAFCNELRQAVRECRERGLVMASKWAAELLTSIPSFSRPLPEPEDISIPSFQTSTPLSKSTSAASLQQQQPQQHRPPFPSRLSGVSDFGTPPPPHVMTFQPMGARTGKRKGLLSYQEQDEEDTYQLAKSYFDSHELDRCAWVLHNARKGDDKSLFLKCYAEYLAADKRLQESLPVVMGAPAELLTLTPHLQPILTQLEGATDPFLLYLRALVLSRLHKRPEALDSYINSVVAYPYNWSAWLGLSGLLKSSEEMEHIQSILASKLLPKTQPFLHFFDIHTRLDLHTATETVSLSISSLLDKFPNCIWLKSMKGMVAYHLRDFEAAEEIFDGVREQDPYRLEDIDVYSNMLYVMPKLGKLAKLATDYALVDRNRAEVCCLIGNYYSSRREPLKAIQYFRRSLQLNRDYLPAWTLMGHEYVELKNTHAAIEAYRRAVDVNPRDYRAWYGLGQTYELLDMPQYAILYYNRATSLRPYDSRMWLALAQVYENTQRLQEAIKALERALISSEPEVTMNILSTLANLHDTLGDKHVAAACHRRLLAKAQTEGKPPGEMATSWLWLAKYELSLNDEGDEAVGDASMESAGAGGNTGLAHQYLKNIVEHNVSQKEEAEKMLRNLAAF